MRPIVLRSTLAVAALFSAVAAVQAAELTIYKQPDFRGEQLTLRGGDASLARAGFSDQASSVIVRSGRWEICSQPGYGGDCVTLGPGEYSSLDPRVFHRAESVRVIDEPYVSRREYSGERNAYVESGRGDIELYAHPGFRGRGYRIDRDVYSLQDVHNNDRVSSMVVNGGRWELCTEPGHTGLCQTFGPGEYGHLGKFSYHVESIRRVG